MKKTAVFLCLVLLACLLCACGGHTHTLTYYEAVAPTCGKAGSISHWHCDGCGQNFSDQAGSMPIAEAAMAVAPTGKHAFNGVDACMLCGEKMEGERGEPFTLNSDGESYTFSGGIRADQILIPETYKGKPVTAIGADAFRRNSGLRRIVIPNSVTEIGAGAFADCTGLLEITLGDGVRRIGENAFSGCAMLKKVQVSDVSVWLGITFENAVANPFSYAKELYVKGGLMTDIVVPAGVTEIKPYAFYNMPSLISVRLPDSVSKIGDAAFYACSRMERCTLSEGLREIGAEAFDFCRSLKMLTLPQSLVKIGAGAFGRCTSLVDVTFANTEGWSYNGTALMPAELATPAVAASYLTVSHILEPWLCGED
jgi:hypothetical protein